MSHILQMQVVQNIQQLFYYSAACLLRETAVEWLCLLGFQMSVQAFALDVFHHEVHTLSRGRAVDAFIKFNYLRVI